MTSPWHAGLAHLEAAYRWDEAEMEAEQDARAAEHALRRRPRRRPFVPRPDDAPWSIHYMPLGDPADDTEQDARDRQAWADHDAYCEHLHQLRQDGVL